MSLLAGRNIAVFAVVATPVLTYHLDSILKERGWIVRTAKTVTLRMGRLNAALLIVILLGAAVKVLVVMEPITLQRAIDQTLPVNAVNHLRENPPNGNMFNSYNWGGYLVYALPDQPVFVDGRTDLYGDVLLNEYRDAAVGGRAWRETLEKYDIGYVLVETGSGLALNLLEEPGWRLDYSDNFASVFVKDTD
jgi:hypothetical protein